MNNEAYDRWRQYLIDTGHKYRCPKCVTYNKEPGLCEDCKLEGKSWKQKPTMECPNCGEITFEHTDTLTGQGKSTLEYTCRNCRELGYYNE